MPLVGDGDHHLWNVKMGLRTAHRDLRKIDLNLIPFFAALMRHRSVTQAGRAVSLSQPAASLNLAKLREMFHDDLFVRVGNTLEATPRAVQLMEEIAPALERIVISVSASDIFDPLTDTRCFQLGVGHEVSALIPLLAHRLMQEAPNCTLYVHAIEPRMAWQLFEGRVIGTAVGMLGDQLPASTKKRVIRRNGFCVLRDRASAKVETLDDLCGRNHIVVGAKLASSAVDDTLRAAGRTRHIACALPDYASITPTLVGTDYLCIIPEVFAVVLNLTGSSPEIAVDTLSLDIPCPPVEIAWRSSLDHDPGEEFFRKLIMTLIQEQQALGTAAGSSAR